MMATHVIMPAAANNDAELVNGTLAGDRDAFSQIVSRYQSLICSLAYSATGSLGQSEDLAQETFITAWKHLGHLRERDKLRSWLCGIARNRISNFLRREGREPIHKAEPLENVAETHASGVAPVDQTISNEEQAILWRSLERIPPIYREPLVLFYREHQSIETVAQGLDLSPDAVKQRLARGRKLLQEEVLSFVETALQRSSPGKAFTIAVVAALPASLTVSAKAATLGAAAKGTATAKTAGLMGLLGAVLTPFMVFLGGYTSYRMSMDEARTDLERTYIKRLFRKAIFFTLGICAVLAVPLYFACQNQRDAGLFWDTVVTGLIVVFFLTLGGLALATTAGRRRYLAGMLQEQYCGQYPPAAYEYRSAAAWLGWPLLHVRIGDRFDVIRPPVMAWIAVGSSHSVGLIFASGGLAIAPISFGGIAVGLLSFGAISTGALAMGAFAVGLWATGGLALGWQAFGGWAMGWNAAMGGLVFAHDYALGGIAQALQANTDLARQFAKSSWFLRFAQSAGRHPLIIMLIWVVPMSIQWRIVRRARAGQEQRQNPQLKA